MLQGPQKLKGKHCCQKSRASLSHSIFISVERQLRRPLRGILRSLNNLITGTGPKQHNLGPGNGSKHSGSLTVWPYLPSNFPNISSGMSGKYHAPTSRSGIFGDILPTVCGAPSKLHCKTCRAPTCSSSRNVQQQAIFWHSAYCNNIPLLAILTHKGSRSPLVV